MAFGPHNLVWRRYVHPFRTPAGQNTSVNGRPSIWPFTIAEMNADPIRLNNQLGHYSYFANLLDLCAVAVPNGVLSCGVPMGIP